ncbi:MAG TPA: hypothetical protein VGD40_09790 [Chryseosolibacter sp.]
MESVKSCEDLRRANYITKKIFSERDETFKRKIELFVYMSTTSKIVIGVGLASSALLAAWLLTGTRKEKTKRFISKGTERIKQTIKTEPKARPVFDDSEVHYV